MSLQEDNIYIHLYYKHNLSVKILLINTPIATGQMSMLKEQEQNYTIRLCKRTKYQINSNKGKTWVQFYNLSKTKGTLFLPSPFHLCNTSSAIFVLLLFPSFLLGLELLLVWFGSLRFSQFSSCWLILSVYIIMSFDFPFVRLFGVR